MLEMPKFRDYMRIGRLQTAPATLLLLVISYLIGGGKLFSISGLLLCVFAIFAHGTTFAHNSLMDTISGYDARDPAKKTHPLVKGTVSINEATKVINVGLFFVTIIAVLFILLLNGNHFLALVCLVFFITCGHWYNDNFSKISVWKFIPITLCFTFLAFYGFYLSSKHMSSLMLCVGVYFALTLLFQISYSGELKDCFETKETNLLRCLGARVTTADEGFFVPCYAGFYGWGVKIVNVAVGGYIVYKYVPCPVSIILFLFFAVLMMYFCHQLIKSRKWDRSKSLRDMSLEEVVTIYLIPAVLLPVVGYTEGIFLMVFGIIYFIILNKINWGTTLRPRV